MATHTHETVSTFRNADIEDRILEDPEAIATVERSFHEARNSYVSDAESSRNTNDNPVF
jgi:hypothetical protein